MRFYLKCHNVKQNARQKENIKKIQNNKALEAITFILPRHTSQSGCPLRSLGHLLLVEDQNNMSSRSSSTSIDCTPATLNLSFFFGTITDNSVPCHRRFFFLLVITLNVTMFLILRHIFIKRIDDQS